MMRTLTPIELAVLGKVHAMQAILDTFTREEQEAVNALQISDLVNCTREQRGKFSILRGLHFTDFGQSVMAMVEAGQYDAAATDDAISRTGQSAGPFDLRIFDGWQKILSYSPWRDANYLYLTAFYKETGDELVALMRDLMIDFQEIEHPKYGRVYAVPYIDRTS